jgi:hypothetical protein
LLEYYFVTFDTNVYKITKRTSGVDSCNVCNVFFAQQKTLHIICSQFEKMLKKFGKMKKRGFLIGAFCDRRWGKVGWPGAERRTLVLEEKKEKLARLRNGNGRLSSKFALHFCDF